MVRHGMSNRTIARRLGVSLDAVKFHIGNALGKLGLDGRSDLKHWRGAPITSALRDTEGDDLDRKDVAMNGTVRLGAIGQISRRVSDIPKAVEWYRDVLGLPHLYTFGNLAFFDCGGTRLFLNNEGNSADNGDSILYFRVEDIDAAHAELSARGVTFAGAPHMIHRHDNGVEEWMAFFTDPDGKYLAIMAQVQPKA
jgi:catechol 2,3-dioxygenase-like lactoylglutathione lyase family enzyme